MEVDETDMEARRERAVDDLDILTTLAHMYTWKTQELKQRKGRREEDKGFASGACLDGIVVHVLEGINRAAAEVGVAEHRNTRIGKAKHGGRAFDSETRKRTCVLRMHDAAGWA